MLLNIIIIFIFIAYYIYRGYVCPCPNFLKKTKNNCKRFEIYGLQLNHLVFYFIIGYLFPNQFEFWQLLGLFWELLEFIPTFYSNILPYIGGCIDESNINNFTINILDKSIPRSKLHFWHPKMTDILLNIIGFYLGKKLNN